MRVGAGDAARRNGAAIGPVRPSVRDARDIGGQTIPCGTGMRHRLPLRIDALNQPRRLSHRPTVAHQAARHRCVGTGFSAAVSGIRRTAQRAREPASPSGGTPESSRTHPFDAAPDSAPPITRRPMPVRRTHAKKPRVHKAAGANGTTTT